MSQNNDTFVNVPCRIPKEKNKTSVFPTALTLRRELDVLLLEQQTLSIVLERMGAEPPPPS